MKKIVNHIKQHHKIIELYHKLSHVKVTKYKIPFILLLTTFLTKIGRDHIIDRSAGIAFNFTMSIFPSIIFLFTLIPYIPIENFNVDIMNFLKDTMPESIFSVAEETITDIISNQHSGLMSFGFLFALYAATNGIKSVMTTFNRCYRSADNRGFFVKIFISILILFLLTLVVFLFITITIVTKIYLEKIPMNATFDFYLISGIKYILIIISFWVSFSLIYYIAPAVKKRWSFFSYGSLVGAILAILFSAGFAFYLDNFSTYNKIYGSIGALIGLMLWLYAMSIVLLFGFEVNASIEIAKKQLEKESTGN